MSWASGVYKNMELSAAGLTDIGYRRNSNQDAFLCDSDAGLFIVADGMGGKAGGETASKVVVTIFPILIREELDDLSDPTPDAILSLLEQTLCRLSRDLHHESQKIHEIKGLGSTASVVLIREDVAHIIYAGDSRIYLLRGKQLIQITEDQTTAAALIRTGQLDPEVAKDHPLNHALEEYVGKEGHLHPKTGSRQTQAGDRWLLCSDGLTKGLTGERLHDLLLQPLTPRETCHALIAAAKEADGSDNITAVVVDILSLAAPQDGECLMSR
ncbi:SpoIIE family protein phosphatase [candidate division KSB3 bacterium]|uniref:SpoIIE family protein phosphatase n=1 Tax=candidate division KSB3 bacterium TaxID=2044937 RepID=A0A9D5JTB9_9BACT|nr:SpoIIE family protein phosphatase [candidate division KSB3 bacterium]MBD3323725.1 SpoIIE family protein phosphatase [candidate division KSB3 bacterium]